MSDVDSMEDLTHRLSDVLARVPPRTSDMGTDANTHVDRFSDDYFSSNSHDVRHERNEAQPRRLSYRRDNIQPLRVPESLHSYYDDDVGLDAYPTRYDRALVARQEVAPRRTDVARTYGRESRYVSPSPEKLIYASDAQLVQLGRLDHREPRQLKHSTPSRSLGSIPRDQREFETVVDEGDDDDDEKVDADVENGFHAGPERGKWASNDRFASQPQQKSSLGSDRKPFQQAIPGERSSQNETPKRRSLFSDSHVSQNLVTNSEFNQHERRREQSTRTQRAGSSSASEPFAVALVPRHSDPLTIPGAGLMERISPSRQVPNCGMMLPPMMRMQVLYSPPPPGMSHMHLQPTSYKPRRSFSRDAESGPVAEISGGNSPAKLDISSSSEVANRKADPNASASESFLHALHAQRTDGADSSSPTVSDSRSSSAVEVVGGKTAGNASPLSGGGGEMNSGTPEKDTDRIILKPASRAFKVPEGFNTTDLAPSPVAVSGNSLSTTSSVPVAVFEIVEPHPPTTSVAADASAAPGADVQASVERAPTPVVADDAAVAAAPSNNASPTQDKKAPDVVLPLLPRVAPREGGVLISTPVTVPSHRLPAKEPAGGLNATPYGLKEESGPLAAAQQPNATRPPFNEGVEIRDVSGPLDLNSPQPVALDSPQKPKSWFIPMRDAMNAAQFRMLLRSPGSNTMSREQSAATFSLRARSDEDEAVENHEPVSAAPEEPKKTKKRPDVPKRSKAAPKVPRRRAPKVPKHRASSPTESEAAKSPGSSDKESLVEFPAPPAAASKEGDDDPIKKKKKDKTDGKGSGCSSNGFLCF